ncbi:MAG: pilus (MSHA type) biogenesis protein MshL [Granulosicoccus sp.]
MVRYRNARSRRQCAHRYALKIAHSAVIVLFIGPSLQSCSIDVARLPNAPHELASQGASLHNYAPALDRATVDVEKASRRLPSAPEAGQGQFSEKAAAADKNPDSPGAADSRFTKPESSRPQQTFTVAAIKAPLESILVTLAKDSGLQLQIIGTTNKLVTITARELSLVAVLDILAQQAGFSWELEHPRLMVYTSEPYSFSYPVNYLNMRRHTNSRVGLATQVGTINAADDIVGSVANSSQTQVENTSEHDFWSSLNADLSAIMSAGATGQTASDKPASSGKYSINKEGGLLTVFAAPNIHQTIKRYLQLLHGSSHSQVLIEATVVEVSLSDSFQMGVDWQILAKGVSGISAAQILAGAPQVTAQNVNRLTAPSGFVSLVQQGADQDIRATLGLLETFGDVRVLSRPRVMALNNQSSILKVVDNRVYFTVNIQRRESENDNEIETETEIHTVPVGLVMNVTPQISGDGTVMLNVRPTLSRILGFVNDPNPALAEANVRNGVPEIQVREMETMLRVQSGHVAIIGGLMQETRSGEDSRLPGIGALAGIGRLFSNRSRSSQQTELLIVIRPTVVKADEQGQYQ